MFKDWLSGELRSWYVQSPHKDRIDFVGARLQELKYLPVVVRLHLHEWVRFVRHLEEHALALPCSVHDPEVPRYLAVRFPSGKSQPTARNPVVDPHLPRDGRRRSILPPCPRPTSGDQCPVPAGRPRLSGLPPEASGCRGQDGQQTGFPAHPVYGLPRASRHLDLAGDATGRPPDVLGDAVDRQGARDPAVVCQHLARFPSLGLSPGPPEARPLGGRRLGAAIPTRGYPGPLDGRRDRRTAPGGRSEHGAGQARLRDLAAGGALRHATR